jgi:hypothetical protein
LRKFLFVATIATLATMNPAAAQYLPPAPGSVGVAPGYTAPSNTSPGYKWREQRANDDWRNNTWREQRLNEDLRNNSWRTHRANEDWRRRDSYEKQMTPNNATDRGYIGGTKPTDKTSNNPADINHNQTDSGDVGAR